MTSAMVAGAAQRPAPPGEEPPRLAASGIAFAWGRRPVLEEISFGVAAGEILGFLGPNGAGKSTLFSILTGLVRPDAGRLLLDGRPLPFGSRRLRARLGVVFQEPSLDGKLGARENLLLMASLFGMRGREARARVDRLLAAAGLADRAGDRVEKLSGGMRRRLELARALVHRPAILLLDEPTTGLDAAAFRLTWEALLELRREEGLTLVLTTHRPDEAERCDRLALIHRGRIVACEPPASLRARVEGDVIAVEADDPGPLAAEIAARFGVAARPGPAGVILVRERGHELVPRLVEAFPAGRFRSVSVRTPTLADAFVRLTGGTLDEPGPPPGLARRGGGAAPVPEEEARP